LDAFSKIYKLLSSGVLRPNVISNIPSEARKVLEDVKDLLEFGLGPLDHIKRKVDLVLVGSPGSDEDGYLDALLELMPSDISSSFLSWAKYSNKVIIEASANVRSPEISFSLREKIRYSEDAIGILEELFDGFFYEGPDENNEVLLDRENRSLKFEFEEEIPQNLAFLLREEVVDTVQVRLNLRGVKYRSVAGELIGKIAWLPVYGASPTDEEAEDLVSYVRLRFDLNNSFLIVLDMGINAIKIVERVVKSLFESLYGMDDMLVTLMVPRIMFDSRFEFKAHSKDQYPYVYKLCTRTRPEDESILLADERLVFFLSSAQEGDLSEAVLERLYSTDRIRKAIDICLSKLSDLERRLKGAASGKGAKDKRRELEKEKKREIEVPIPEVIMAFARGLEQIVFYLTEIDVKFPDTFREAGQNVNKVLSDLENWYDLDILNPDLKRKLRSEVGVWPAGGKPESHIYNIGRDFKIFLVSLLKALEKYIEICDSNRTIKLSLSSSKDSEELDSFDEGLLLWFISMFKEGLSSIKSELTESRGQLDIIMGEILDIEEVRESQEIRGLREFLQTGFLKKLDTTSLGPSEDALLRATVFSGPITLDRIICVVYNREKFSSLIKEEYREDFRNLADRAFRLIRGRYSSPTLRQVAKRVLGGYE